MYHSGSLPLTTESPEQAFEGEGGGGGVKNCQNGSQRKALPTVQDQATPDSQNFL